MKVSEFKILAHSKLKQRYSKDEIAHLINILTEERLFMSRIDLIKRGDFRLSDEAKNQLQSDIELLADDKPIQYIIGKVKFFGLDLFVNESALIPRNETEEMVALITDDYKQSQSLPNNIIDFGTGSGCIALAMAKNFRTAKVEAWDISSEALALAEENSKLNKIKVKFVLSSILSDALNTDTMYDLMISNPPYIPPSQKLGMEDRVMSYEPNLALFVEEEDPLVFYRAIVLKALQSLRKGGRLYFEINQYLAEETMSLLEMGFKAELLKDLNGNWRFIRAERT